MNDIIFVNRDFNSVIRPVVGRQRIKIVYGILNQIVPYAVIGDRSDNIAGHVSLNHVDLVFAVDRHPHHIAAVFIGADQQRILQPAGQGFAGVIQIVMIIAFRHTEAYVRKSGLVDGNRCSEAPVFNVLCGAGNNLRRCNDIAGIIGFRIDDSIQNRNDVQMAVIRVNGKISRISVGNRHRIRPLSRDAAEGNDP